MTDKSQKPITGIFFIVLTLDEKRLLTELKQKHLAGGTKKSVLIYNFLRQLLSAQQVYLGNYAEECRTQALKQELYDAFQELGSKLRNKENFPSLLFHSVPDDILAQQS